MSGIYQLIRLSRVIYKRDIIVTLITSVFLGRCTFRADNMSNEPKAEGSQKKKPKLKRMPKIPEDRYKILEVLGSGGMGVVLKATHVHLNRPVAIKVLNTTQITQDENIKRFELEAQAGSQLSHPNLVDVFDYGITEDGEPFLVMEFIEGETLWNILDKEGKISNENFYHIFKQITKAIQYIHRHNIVHRDIKTSNIMLHKIGDDLYPKLLDFGIAKVLEDSGFSAHNLTSTGTAFGSPLYMSPENCLGKEIDFRSDIYSLGCVMYECINGAPPIVGENVLATIQNQISELPPPLAILRSPDPADKSLGKLIHKCIEKEPERRFQSMQELIHDLNTAEEESKLENRSLSVFNSTNPRMDRWTKTRLPAQSNPLETTASTPLNNPQEEEEKPPTKKADLFKTVAEHTAQEPAGTTGNASLQDTIIENVKKEASGKTNSTGKDPDGFATGPLGLLRPEYTAVLCLAIVAALFFTGPYASTFIEKFVGNNSLVQAEDLFGKGKSNWTGAKAHYEAALKYATMQNDKAAEGMISYRLAEINLYQGKFIKAQQLYSTAIDLLEPAKENHQSVYLESMIGLAKSYNRQKQYKNAEKVFNETISLADKWDVEPSKYGDILLLQAENYSTSNKRVMLALSFFDFAIKEYSKPEDKPYEKICSAWIESAEVSTKMRWWGETKKRLQNAIETLPKISSASKKQELEDRARKLKDQLDDASKQPPPVIPPPSSQNKVEDSTSNDPAKQMIQFQQRRFRHPGPRFRHRPGGFFNRARQHN